MPRRRGRGRGRGRNEMRLSVERNEEIDRISNAEPIEQQTKSLSELPTEIMEMIISRLTLIDNIRVSAVCKTWHKAAISVRNADKPPLLMVFPKSGNSYEFYDPSERKSFWLDFPELQESRVCYTRDGWFLMCKPHTSIIFLFSPYTQKKIELPDLDLTSRNVAFSASPTSPDCILFATKYDSDLIISRCRPGETEWTTVSYQMNTSFSFSYWDKILVSRGIFYCVYLPRLLGVYNPYTLAWNLYTIPLDSRPETIFIDWKKIKYVAELNGQVFIVVAYAYGDPRVYKIDLTTKVLSKMESLGGMTLFANCLSSLARTDLLGTMRDKIYFSKVQYYGKRCISYSHNEGRYYPKKKEYDWEEEELLDSIWIEPPENISDFR